MCVTIAYWHLFCGAHTASESVPAVRSILMLRSLSWDCRLTAAQSKRSLDTTAGRTSMFSEDFCWIIKPVTAVTFLFVSEIVLVNFHSVEFLPNHLHILTVYRYLDNKNTCMLSVSLFTSILMKKAAGKLLEMNDLMLSFFITHAACTWKLWLFCM